MDETTSTLGRWQTEEKSHDKSLCEEISTIFILYSIRKDRKKMQDLKTTKRLVADALEKHPQTRNSDNYLYYIICKGQLEKQGLDIDRISFANALLHRKEYDLPPFESVRRSRQKAQEKNPELAALPEVEDARLQLEEQYREFARG